jgi:haloalkane dehalogenase
MLDGQQWLTIYGSNEGQPTTEIVMSNSERTEPATQPSDAALMRAGGSGGFPVDHAAYPFLSRYRSVSDGRLHYVDEGRGETIVFSHGTPTWSFEWRHLISGLATDARSVAVDHLGFGLSDRPRSADYSPEAHARRFCEFADALGLDGVTLVVHDFGGPIALPWALSRPERVRRLVVINSFMWPLTDDPDMRTLAKLAGGSAMRLLYKYANASLRIIAPSAYGDRRKLTPAVHSQYLAPFRDRWAREHVLWALARALEGSSEFYRSLFERRHALADIPSLVIWGMKDSAFKPRMLEKWSEALPHARRIEIDGAGHWPHEEDPLAVLGALRDFMRMP